MKETAMIKLRDFQRSYLLLVSYIPARSATRTDPMTALNHNT
jgi:hypothetical protein